ncbi:MAG TPA: AAA family ATPase [Chitinophagales bacterium]|nr:AAA family ATPase [Chitinophagales bacterium]
MQIEKKLINFINSGAKVIQLVSYETLRIHGIVNETAKSINRSWFTWNRIEGLKKWDWEKFDFEVVADNLRTPEKILDYFRDELQDHSILILEDFHNELKYEEVGTNAFNTIRRLRNYILNDRNNKTLILAQPVNYIPNELEKEIQLIEIPYPSLPDLSAVFDQVVAKFNIPADRIQKTEKLISASLGLTIMEAEFAFAKAYNEKGKLSDYEIPLIIAEKENIIKKSGYLEYYHPKESLSDVGGLENLKSWLRRRQRAFETGAADYGLDTPKGILMLGIPGTGKSLTAKAVANQWQFPLLRMDLGKIFGGIVGESERNIREALKVAEALAPSILWVDEIEKGLAVGGESDGGTSSRVLGTFLTWMQEKTKPVFVVATANNLTLPPELLRKGRIDEIFFVDLPGPKARKEILSIHLSKKKRELEAFDLDKLVEVSKGLSGAELQEAVKEALYQAFDRNEELDTEYLVNAIKKTYPLSKIMAEDIENLRKWADGRTVKASEEDSDKVDLKPEDKERPKLKQEYVNPFMKS